MVVLASPSLRRKANMHNDRTLGNASVITSGAIDDLIAREYSPWLLREHV